MPPSGSSGKMSKFASFIMGLAYGYKGKPGMVKTYPMKEFKGVVPEGATVYYANKKLDVIQKNLYLQYSYNCGTRVERPAFGRNL
jgi:hypothetical protein